MKDKTSVDILKDLLRFDTQNPPGNEEEIVGYIHDFCEELQISNTVYTYGDHRSNIIIRLGKRTDENLVLLGHTDVVKAQASDWKHDPFSAEVHDGFLYGRGALDMKYFIAACLSTLRSLKAIEPSLDRGITAVFTADEEAGSNWGIQKLLLEEGIKEELSHSLVLNEGGGFSVFYRDTCYYLFETGQKSVCRLEITIPEEKNSDPYFPTLSHEATLVSVLRKMDGLQLDESLPQTVQKLLSIFDLSDETMDSGLQRLLQTMTASMVTPTIIHGGGRNPSLTRPDRVVVDFDCRLLPGISEEAFIGKVHEALQDLPVTVKTLHFSQGYEANIDRPILKLMEKTLQEQESQIACLVPFITPGSNDGKFLKPLGCDILGFAPLDKDESFTSIMPLIHGLNERISLKSIEFCENVLSNLCKQYLIGDTYLG
jgi:acetylornithine deacetylase/succinyl-diaminopimelate desuccinylase-like protein